jgi:dynein heavy chain 1, cytosolic
MNPGYAGRSALPDNLKQLFREVAMMTPNKALIAQVIMFSQGFQSGERLAGKICSLFDLCLDQLSAQPHYDFGLRSLKAVLGTAGQIKREKAADMAKKGLPQLGTEETVKDEQAILIRSVCNTLVPKLVAQDKPLLRSLLVGVFPGSDLVVVEEAILEQEIKKLSLKRHYACTPIFMEKCLQLYQIQR